MHYLICYLIESLKTGYNPSTSCFIWLPLNKQRTVACNVDFKNFKHLLPYCEGQEQDA